MTDLLCRCRGMIYEAFVALDKEPPLYPDQCENQATEEDGLCDVCRTVNEACLRDLREHPEAFQEVWL